MSRNNNQPPREPDVAYRIDGQVHTEEGPVTHGTFWKRDGISDEETREVIAESRGTDPDKVLFAGEVTPELAAAVTANSALRRRMSVGFSKWNSSWDPDKERKQREQQSGGDPSMN